MIRVIVFVVWYVCGKKDNGQAGLINAEAFRKSDWPFEDLTGPCLIDFVRSGGGSHEIPSRQARSQAQCILLIRREPTHGSC